MAMSRHVRSGLERADRRHAGASVPVLIGAVVVFTAIGMAARYAPDLLTSLLVVGAVAGLAVVGARGRRVQGTGVELERAGEAGLAPTHSAGDLASWVTGVVGPFQYQLHRAEPAGQPDGRSIELIGRDPWGELIVVRCQSNPPGERVGLLDMLRLIAAVIQERAEGGVLVTTTSFTPAAITLAGYGPVPIALYDGSALARPEWVGSAA